MIVGLCGGCGMRNWAVRLLVRGKLAGSRKWLLLDQVSHTVQRSSQPVRNPDVWPRAVPGNYYSFDILRKSHRPLRPPVGYATPADYAIPAIPGLRAVGIRRRGLAPLRAGTEGNFGP